MTNKQPDPPESPPETDPETPLTMAVLEAQTTSILTAIREMRKRLNRLCLSVEDFLNQASQTIDWTERIKR